MNIEVFADIVCPWCYIGERRLQQALSTHPQGGAVEVTIRPFQLDPRAPTVPRPLHEYLMQRFGAVAPAMQRHVEQGAAGTGIEFNWDRAIAVNTRDAHRLLLLARREYGNTATLNLIEALFAAHFTHGIDVSDHSSLASLAADAGIPADRARQYLAGDEGKDELDRELAAASRLGIQSVPTFVFNGAHAVAGAQPVSVLLQLLREAA
jgi:predicted DsbA family dithiol-disulfide isomerase